MADAMDRIRAAEERSNAVIERTTTARQAHYGAREAVERNGDETREIQPGNRQCG